MLEKVLNSKSWESERMAFFERFYSAPVGPLVSLHRAVGLADAVASMPADSRLDMLPLLRFDSEVAQGRPQYDIFDLTRFRTGIFLYLGIGRSGKTASMYDIVSRAASRTFFLEVEKGTWVGLPDAVRINFNSIPKDMLFALRPKGGEVLDAVMDDAALFGSARKTGDGFNKALLEYVTIISHKDIRLHVLIQNTGLLDIKALRGQGIHILQKYSPAVAASLEREEFRHQVEVANTVLKMYSDAHSVDVRWFLYDHFDRRVYLSMLPEWYNDALSKPYKNYVVKLEGKK